MASGYDLSSKVPYRLMMGRLGVYDKRPFDPSKNTIEGVDNQATKARFNGGNRQQERMIRDKRRSLDRAVWNSYQAAEIVSIDATDRKPFRALINPNKLKQDYDDKILSIGFEYNIEAGDIFEWVGTNTKWLVYLQDMTELAYFRGYIRRCCYEINWEDEDGLHTTYAAVRGPVETKINYIQKHNISIDTPNHSLHILMPLNEETLKYFKRYSKFYLKNDIKPEKICWRVEGIDWISTPNILEVTAVEYYANEHEDDIDNGIVGGLIVEPENPNTNTVEATIEGETFIKVKKTYSYLYNGEEEGNWYVDEKYPVVLTVNEKNPKEVLLKWNTPYCGQFELQYGDCIKTIVVESLF